MKCFKTKSKFKFQHTSSSSCFNTQNVAKFCSRQFLVLVLRLLSFFLFSEHRVILLLSKNKLLALGVHKPLTFL